MKYGLPLDMFIVLVLVFELCWNFTYKRSVLHKFGGQPLVLKKMELKEEIKALLNEGRKIEAIRLYRHRNPDAELFDAIRFIHAINMRINQISPFNYQQDVGELYIKIKEALELAEKSWIQSPHWNHEPTKEELHQEEIWINESKQAYNELIYKAAEIFTKLTGQVIPEGWLKRMNDV